MKGKLITLEGTDGGGKSIQSKLLGRYLKKLGYKVIVTREPGNRRIRNILLDPKNRSIDGITELFLYMADRGQHVKETILPFLRKGYIIICDRFTDSTVAYQGYGRGLPLGLIHRLNRLATRGIKPDLTIILDVPLRLGLRRAIKSRMEMEKFKFYRNVHYGYMQLAKREPGRIKVVKVDGDVQSIQEKIRGVVRCLLRI